MNTPIAQRLAMDHLSLNEIKDEVESDTPIVALEAEPPDEETWTFAFSFTDRRGKVWDGTFTNEILTNGQQSKVAVVRARLQGGLPAESIDPSIVDLNWAKAHLAYSLRQCPEWAKNLEAIRDPDVIMKLWDRVSAHEARYFRRDQAEGAGPSGG